MEMLLAPELWRKSCTNTESRLHQISPFIGKLKSVIADDLIEAYSKPGDLIVDPFAGSGTIPLAALILGRRVFASDISNYSAILTKAKLFPPADLNEALGKLEEISNNLIVVNDIAWVPDWVRRFFNPNTLAEIISWCEVLRKEGNEFFFACLLGILHHQRPGFLSYPSSHLVPYLRDKKFPRDNFPELYEYRPVLPRLRQKVIRAFKRIAPQLNVGREVVLAGIDNVVFPDNVNCVITSPPYMNALDYYRDNRLRLWFICPEFNLSTIKEPTNYKDDFINAITTLFVKTDIALIKNGYCILILGDLGNKILDNKYLIDSVSTIQTNVAPSLHLENIINDIVPDVRRSRRNCRGIKEEYILIYRKVR